MKNFFKKYSIAVLVGLVLLGAGAVYLFDELIDDDRIMMTNSNTATNANNSGQVISEAEVKKIVEKTVGKNDLTYAYITLKTDDGVQEYDVEATSGNTVYDLEINATSGQVLSSEQESISNNAAGTTTNSSASISEDKVKEIVEKASGKSNLTYTQIRLSQEDDYNGALVYDVTAYADGTEYDYDIDATSGEILSQSTEAASN